MLADLRSKIEFVQDKKSKTPFPSAAGIANAVHTKGLVDVGIVLYPGTGTLDGVEGDHVLIAPAYTCTREEIAGMVDKVYETVKRSFD